MDWLAKAIGQTLSYFDRYEYPLTAEEIHHWLATRSSLLGVKRKLSFLVKTGQVQTKDGYFFLSGRQKLLSLRQKREAWSTEKQPIVKKTVQRLRFLPGIKLVGLTGALAMNNAKEDDDIDLLIITAKDTLWIVRLLIILLSPFLGIKRRKYAEREVKNKICFNLFLDESALEVEPKNLYIAHEICQLKPLYNQNQTYEKFLAANAWVKNYLPQAIGNFQFFTLNFQSKSNFQFLISKLNRLAFKIQYFYMKSKMTNERVSLCQAFFHPRPAVCA